MSYKPRLCHIVKDASGYGFHLQSVKGKIGQCVHKVEPNSPADQAGLKKGDQIVEVNGVNVEDLPHAEVIQKIKSRSNKTIFLVVDEEALQYFKENNIPITQDLLENTASDEIESLTTDATETTSISPPETSDSLRPRLCHLERGSDGYGFNLHSEKGIRGRFIQSVASDSVATAAGLREGDRIIEINGTNVEHQKHAAIVNAIKESGNQVEILVVDVATDEYFKSCNTIPTSEHISGLLPTPVPAEKPAVIHPHPDTPPNTPAENTSSASSRQDASQSNGFDPLNFDMSRLKERSRSSRKKAPPAINWNNRLAVFDNL